MPSDLLNCTDQNSVAAAFNSLSHYIFVQNLECMNKIAWIVSHLLGLYKFWSVTFVTAGIRIIVSIRRDLTEL